VLGVLRYLVSPEAAGDAGERLQRSAQLSADDRAAFLQALLQVRPSLRRPANQACILLCAHGRGRALGTQTAGGVCCPDRVAHELKGFAGSAAHPAARRALVGSGQGARPRRAQRSAKAADPTFREALFDALVELRAARELLQLDSPALERHLRASGGLPERGPLAAGAPVGHLEPPQARPRGAGVSRRPGARRRARGGGRAAAVQRAERLPHGG